jgi:hypothetical protein
MQSKYDILRENEQDAQKASQELTHLLEEFLSPLLQVLDQLIDKRLIRTLVQVCVVIIRFRNQKQGLLLSEMGSYMDGYQGLSRSAPAGTKRISNLLRSLKWNIFQIDDYLLKEADKEVKKLKMQGKRVLCPWDDSVVEKPESRVLEGLCPVASSKAKRLQRSQKWLVFNFPPKKPITVAGMQWTAALITGMEGRVSVALMSWWSTKGEYAVKLREQQEALLRKCVRVWGDGLLHLFDRGYAGGPWLQVLQSLKVHFVIRWKKGHVFVNAQGVEKKLWQMGQGKKYLAHTELRDTHTGEKMPCDVWWTPLWHPDYLYQLYLVKVRVRKKVWYLITNEPIKKEEQAWEIVFAYRRRWQIELSFRYGKCELGMESPRLWSFENRLKLLGIVTLVYAFLLHLLNPVYRSLISLLLQLKCHRTGKQCRGARAPLYRLRWAISRLWDDYHPALGALFPPNVQSLRVLAAKRC